MSLPEALDEAGLESEDLNSPGWLGVSAGGFWDTEEEVGAFDFLLVLASVPSVCAGESLDARERGVVLEVEVGVDFVVSPDFFGWVDLAEETQEKERREKLDFFFPSGAPVSTHR